LLAVLGLATSDMDDDSRSTTEKVTNEQLHIIRDLLISKELLENKLVEFLKVDKLEELPASDYMKALAAINSAKKGAK
jgi:hypothetical protein